MSVDLSNLEKLKISLTNLDAKKSKILFFMPDVKIPSGSVYELYFHAAALKEKGYKVIILTENDKYEKPEFIEPELMDHEHISVENNTTLTVAPEDILVIPEIFTNVMKETEKLPCMRVVLFQSVDNATKGLMPGTDWTMFNIKYVIATSKVGAQFVEEFYGKNKFVIKNYNVSVPDYFQDKYPLKRPVVSIFVRNEKDLDKIVKLFLSKYPQYRWLNFEPLLTESKPPKYLRRRDFADRLAKNFAALWIDRISTHAQFPLECMKVGTVPISYIPDITPEYIVENNKLIENSGVWTDDFFQLPALIADTLRKFLDDEIGDEVYAKMKDIVSQYSPEISKLQLIDIYEGIIDDRRQMYLKTIEALEARIAQSNVQPEQEVKV